MSAIASKAGDSSASDSLAGDAPAGSGAGAHNAHPRRGTPEGAENYLKAIYQLERRGPEPVGTGAIAERVGVTPASASAMLRRLADEDLLEHALYHGVRLTAAGERIALGVVRRHRLLELFLAEVLEMPWDRVHAEAEVLEHHLSDELVEAIARKLGDPTIDPHGDPIPDAELNMAEADTAPLASIEPGRRVTFVRVSDSDPEMLRHLTEHQIRPGAALEVTGREPFGGSLEVRIDGRTHLLGGQLVERMRVRSS